MIKEAQNQSAQVSPIRLCADLFRASFASKKNPECMTCIYILVS